MDEDNWAGSRDRRAEGVRTGAKGDDGGGGGALSTSSPLPLPPSACDGGGGGETRSFPPNDDDDDDDDDGRGRFLRSSRRDESISRIRGWTFILRRLGIILRMDGWMGGSQFASYPGFTSKKGKRTAQAGLGRSAPPRARLLSEIEILGKSTLNITLSKEYQFQR